VSGYTIRNLKAVENAAAKFGLAPALEARFATDELECERTGLSYQRLAPNARGPFGHRHEEQEEVYVVVGGKGRVNVGGDEVELEQWDAVRVSPEIVRAFEAGPEGLELVVFGASRRGKREAELLQGWWGD
jgi:mannose-6-phosphate isomerase-like protein (cupin superfamily)